MLATPPPRSRAVRRGLRLAALLVVLGGAAGCFSLSGRVERALEERLPEAIGPAESYRVEVEGLRARSGHARRVVVVGERVAPEEAPVVDRLDLTLHGVRYDRGRDRVERIDAAEATVRLLPADLAAFLEAQRGVRDAAVTLRAPDAATISLRPELGGFSLPAGVRVELAGRFEGDGSRVRFVVDTLRAGSFDLGAAAARRLSDVVNPLVDLADLPADLPLTDLRVTGLRIADGVLVLDAEGGEGPRP